MSISLILILVVPLAGAVLAPAFGDVPAQRRLVVPLCSAVAVGAATWAVVRTVSGSGVAWRSFALDPWRALLVFGALIACAAAVARAEFSARPGLTIAAFFAATAAGVAPLVVSGVHLLAVTLPVATAAVAVASFAATDDPVRALRAARALTLLIVSDSLALVALGMAVRRGAALPPHVSATTAAFLLAAAVIRLGLAPAAGPAEDAHGGHRAIGLLWLGPVRAQGFLLAVFAVGAHRSVAHAAAGVAAFGVLVAGVTASRREGASTLAGLGTGVALLGLALGGATPTWGAALAVAAAFAAPTAWYAGGAWSAGARASVASLPAGGLLAGSALVLGAAFGAGAIDHWFLAAAVPAAAGLLAASSSVWSVREDARPRGIAAAFAGSIGIAVGLALAAVPERATNWLAVPVAATLGEGRLLSVGGEHGLEAGLAVAVLGVAAVAFVAGPGRLGSGGAPNVRGRRRLAIGLDWWAAAAGAPEPGSGHRAGRAALEARRWAIAAAGLFVVSVGLAARAYIVAAGGGFL